MNSPDYQLLLRRILGSRVIAYYPSLAPIVGGVKAAILLSQLLYLDNRQDVPGSWFTVSVPSEDANGTDALELMTGLSIKEQRTARRALASHRLIAADRRGMPAEYHYRVDLDRLAALAAGQVELPIEWPDGSVKTVPTVDSRVARSAGKELPVGAVIKKVLKKEEQKGSKKSAASGRPPAVELARRVLHRYPHKSLWGTLDRTVGSAFPDLLRWGRVLRSWKLAGYNPTNLRGMLDVFANGWSPRRGGRNSSVAYDPAADLAAFRKEHNLHD